MSRLCSRGKARASRGRRGYNPCHPMTNENWGAGRSRGPNITVTQKWRRLKLGTRKSVSFDKSAHKCKLQAWRLSFDARKRKSTKYFSTKKYQNHDKSIISTRETFQSSFPRSWFLSVSYIKLYQCNLIFSQWKWKVPSFPINRKHNTEISA